MMRLKRMAIGAMVAVLMLPLFSVKFQTVVSRQSPAVATAVTPEEPSVPQWAANLALPVLSGPAEARAEYGDDLITPPYYTWIWAFIIARLAALDADMFAGSEYEGSWG